MRCLSVLVAPAGLKWLNDSWLWHLNVVRWENMLPLLWLSSLLITSRPHKIVLFAIMLNWSCSLTWVVIIWNIVFLIIFLNLLLFPSKSYIISRERNSFILQGTLNYRKYSIFFKITICNRKKQFKQTGRCCVVYVNYCPADKSIQFICGPRMDPWSITIVRSLSVDHPPKLLKCHDGKLVSD